MINRLAFTGHRPDKLGGYGLKAKRRLVALARDIIVETECKRVITGMALGWDQAVAEAAMDVGVPFAAAVPFRGQEDRWPIESQRHYNWLLGHSAGDVLIFDGYPDDVEMRRAMQKRNEWMVDNSDHLAALWNGTPGGTANCVKYAKRIGRPFTNHWDRYEANLSADLWAMLS